MLDGKPDRIIEEIYILIAEDKEGLEGITMTFPPLLTSNKKIALEMFNRMKGNPQIPKGIKLKLCKFSNKEVVATYSVAND